MPDFSDFRRFVKFEEDEIVGNGHQKGDFIVQCIFDGHVCDDKMTFYEFQHASFGNCFTFNAAVRPRTPNISQVTSTSNVGSENGLILSLFFENDEYLGALGQTSGANLVLHNSDEHPPLLTKSILINSGTLTRINLEQESVFRRSEPFSDCTNEWPTFLELNEMYKKYRYTFDFCIYLCKQKSLAERCECTDTFDWDFSDNESIKQRAKKNCDVWNITEYDCMVSVYTDFNRGSLSCECPNPCSDKLFKSTRSAATWPSSAYLSHFVSLMKQSKSDKVRKLINNLLASTFTNESTNFNLYDQVKNNFARLEVHFETMVFQEIKETPKYNLSILFGTIGGNLGLWLGCSVLSVLEVLQWMGMTIVLFVMKIRKTKADSSTKEKGPYV